METNNFQTMSVFCHFQRISKKEIFFSIQPGVGSVKSPDDLTIEKRNVTTADTLMDLVRNLFPENIIQVGATSFLNILFSRFNFKPE